MLCHAAYGKSNMHTQVLGKDRYVRLKTAETANVSQFKVNIFHKPVTAH